MDIDWKTPPELFGTLDAEFQFNMDVCALPWNAQCEKFFSPADDGLRQRWTGICWCNPPFDASQGLWVRKAWQESQRGATVCVLLPGNYHDSDWWHKYALRAAEIRYMRGRARFLAQDGRETSMRTVLLVFRPYYDGPTIAVSTKKDGRPNTASSRLPDLADLWDTAEDESLVVTPAAADAYR